MLACMLHCYWNGRWSTGYFTGWWVYGLILYHQQIYTISIYINAQRYHCMVSLACDYLAIMASSVSSEWTFSKVDHISNCCSYLKGDIVLQFINGVILHNLLFSMNWAIICCWRQTVDYAMDTESGEQQKMMNELAGHYIWLRMEMTDDDEEWGPRY